MDAAEMNLAETRGIIGRAESGALERSGGVSPFAGRDKEEAIKGSGVLARVLSGNL